MTNDSGKINFSIIIPFYNCEMYIAKCIDSALNQTYKNFEIILIDDGSTDGSLIIVEKYKNSFNNIILFSQENSGPFEARLFGANQAHGEYLLFVDADDELHPDALNVINNRLQARGHTLANQLEENRSL